MKMSLFCLIYPPNSNSREISVLFVEFLTSAESFTGETVITTTDQRNFSIILIPLFHQRTKGPD